MSADPQRAGPGALTPERLIAAARGARAQAYAPYSRYRVGAAALSDGVVFSGANVENASYGLSVCAERVAIFLAAAAGHRKVREVAVVTAGHRGAAPCGACRQVMAEFGVEKVYLAGPQGRYRVLTFEDLLPEAFGPGDLPATSRPDRAVRQATPASRVDRRTKRTRR